MMWIQQHPVATTFIVIGVLALLYVIIRSGAAGALLEAIGDALT
uniref:Uncharacterized protein n=1 Tax=Pseudomonas phage Cygsa01 TaxID=3138529 RepID=A0AAU6W438_9VIRU